MSVYSKNRYNKNRPNDAWFKIFSFIKPNSKILDIGCSSGQLGKALKKEKGAYIVGLDIDEDDVTLAKKNLDEAYRADIEKDDLKKYGLFDYVIMADVIEHLVDPVKALIKIKKLLKPDGRLVFSIPNMANVTVRLDLLRGRFAYKEFGLLDKTHLHFYDQAEVNRVMQAAGFAVDKTDCTLRPIPKDLLASELNKVGITLTPKLTKLLNEDEAIIYQFIGIAKPGQPRQIKPASTTQLDVISLLIEEIKDDHNQELAGKTKQIHHLEKEIKRLDAELSAILNSKGWKALKKLHTVKHKLTPPRKRSR